MDSKLVGIQLHLLFQTCAYKMKKISVLTHNIYIISLNTQRYVKNLIIFMDSISDITSQLAAGSRKAVYL